jgi:hypothetical protein
MVLLYKTIYICIQFYTYVVHHINNRYMGDLQEGILEIYKQKTLTIL